MYSAALKLITVAFASFPHLPLCSCSDALPSYELSSGIPLVSPWTSLLEALSTPGGTEILALSGAPKTAGNAA